jgi:hypothetical protein
MNGIDAQPVTGGDGEKQLGVKAAWGQASKISS